MSRSVTAPPKQQRSRSAPKSRTESAAGIRRRARREQRGSSRGRLWKSRSEAGDEERGTCVPAPAGGSTKTRQNDRAGGSACTWEALGETRRASSANGPNCRHGRSSASHAERLRRTQHGGTSGEAVQTSTRGGWRPCDSSSTMGSAHARRCRLLTASGAAHDRPQSAPSSRESSRSPLSSPTAVGDDAARSVTADDRRIDEQDSHRPAPQRTGDYGAALACRGVRAVGVTSSPLTPRAIADDAMHRLGAEHGTPVAASGPVPFRTERLVWYCVREGTRDRAATTAPTRTPGVQERASCGMRTPRARSNHAGTPAPVSACSSSPKTLGSGREAISRSGSRARLLQAPRHSPQSAPHWRGEHSRTTSERRRLSVVLKRYRRSAEIAGRRGVV